MIAACTSQATGLIQHWNGSTWTLMPLPDPNPANPGMTQSLSSISSDSATDVWAAGLYTIVYAPTGIRYEPYSLHWNGSMWTVVAMPPVPGSDGHLVYQFKTIDAVSPTNVGGRSIRRRCWCRRHAHSHPHRALERHRVERRAQPDGRYVAVPERRDRDERVERVGRRL